MRIMFCTRAGAGHFGPLVPFARAFLRNNDEVVFVAPAESAAMIAGAGFDHELIPDPGWSRGARRLRGRAGEGCKPSHSSACAASLLRNAPSVGSRDAA
jgi:hypothetical protein